MKLHHLAYSLALTALLVASALPAASPDYHESEARLVLVRERIRQVQAQLQREQAQQDAASGQLRKLGDRIAQTAARLRDLERQLTAAQGRVATLRREVSAQQARIDGNRDELGRQLRAAYASSRDGYLKLLLSTDDPLQLGRVLTYHRYLQAARRQELEAATAELQRLDELERKLAAETAKLTELRDQELAAQRKVAAARRERAAALAAIEARIAAGGQELSRLQADAAALELLLARLRDALADVKDLRFDQRPFTARRGRLAWPLKGTLLARFGEERGLGEMRWSGVLIAAQPGDPVRAVARGRVVFADWLRGFGLLLIVDHGDGFMTLYGHNEAIYKETGDWVQPGDIVAAVGAGGTRRAPGLYFEVRSKGEPVDPLLWLQPTGGR